MRSLLLITLLALCSFSLLAQRISSYSDPKAAAAYQQAVAYLDAGRVEQAKSQLFLALRYQNGHLESLRQLADLYYTQNQIDSAIYYYEQNVNLVPRDIYAHNWLVTIYIQQKNYEAALIQYDLILRTFSDRPEVRADTYYNIASVEFRHMNRWQSAIDMSEEALRNYLGIVSLIENENDKAMVNTKAARARMIAAKGYYILGNYKIALRYLKENEKYLAADPEYMFFLGNTYYQLDKTEKGEVYIRQALLNGYELPREILESGYELPRELLREHPEYQKN